MSTLNGLVGVWPDELALFWLGWAGRGWAGI